MNTKAQSGSAARKASASPLLKGLARAGYAASGLVHVLLGILAIQVALGGGGESDQSGAMSRLASLPAGAVLLWIVVVGLFALGLWFLVEAVLGEGSSADKRWKRTLSSLGKAIPYLALAVTALRFALGGSSSSSDSTQSASASVLSLPGGQLLLALIGLIAIGIGGYFVYRGAARKFRKDLRIPDSGAERPVLILGTVGYIAKGVAVAVVGILFVVAAFTLDPEQASGLDGALKSLVSLPFGVAILVAVGVGLIAYGLYNFARARYAKI